MIEKLVDVFIDMQQNKFRNSYNIIKVFYVSILFVISKN